MDSNLKIYLKSKAIKLSEYFNTHYKFIRPNYITTFGILLNASALMNLLTNHFIVFLLLFFTGYFCDILDGTYAKKYNYETKFGQFYDRFADWLRLISVYIIFTGLYKNKINSLSIGIVISIFMLCNLNYMLKNIDKKDNKCIEIWKKCIKKIDKDSIYYYSNFTKFFDESMVIIYLMIVMTYIYYKK